MENYAVHSIAFFDKHHAVYWAQISLVLRASHLSGARLIGAGNSYQSMDKN
ncbi:MAG: hypothetical protein VB035_06745 [Candidatus Fimivivens sp.]|nr:hypothetical protein [Candidatus Fimivivens sp.]